MGYDFSIWKKQTSYICPVCAQKNRAIAKALRYNEKNSLVCENGHCFDISAQGYVNLLLAQNKNTKDPGDSREMVKARSEFLNSGAYEPLRSAICSAATELCRNICSLTAADCGCGELYYTRELFNKLSEREKNVVLHALDISKQALSAAKNRLCEGIFPAVASSFRLPLADESLDLATVIFAPFVTEELLRTLKRGGYVISAIPAKEHLYALKSLIYENAYYNEVKPYETAGFDFLGKHDVSCKLSICSQSLLNALFTMTPYYYKTSPKDAQALYSYFETHEYFEDTAAFEVLMYRKK